MEKMQDLAALLKHEVEDLISAEDQILDALPQMIEKAKNNTLKKALRDHLATTKKQRARLDKVQKLLGKTDSGESRKGFLSSLFGGSSTHECKGMKGIIEEGQKILNEDMAEAVKDAAIIASAQKVEHYEICGYGTACAYARELNLTDVAKLLQETLDEEYAADRLLTDIAEGDINEKAEGKKRTVKAAKAANNIKKGNAAPAKKVASARGNTRTTAKPTAKKAAAKAAKSKTASKGSKR